MLDMSSKSLENQRKERWIAKKIDKETINAINKQKQYMRSVINEDGTRKDRSADLNFGEWIITFLIFICMLPIGVITIISGLIFRKIRKIDWRKNVNS
jgi:hypothetical protein